MQLFFIGELKKKLLKPSEIENPKEYYCVSDVPKNGIAKWDYGYFIPTEAFNNITRQYINQNNDLQKELDDLRIEYDLLQRKYNRLLDKLEERKSFNDCEQSYLQSAT